MEKRRWKKDKWCICETDTGIVLEAFNVTEENKAKERFDFMSNYHHDRRLELKIINDYWGS